MISRIAKEKGKLAALTETGMEEITEDHWYTNHLLKAIKDSEEPLTISYIMVWRNANRNHYYVPYKGHPAEEDFSEFCEDPLILLENDIQNIYTEGEHFSSE